MLSLSLRLKSLVVGSSLESRARQVRHLLNTIRPNLELAEILLEEKRLPLVLSRLLTRQSNVLDVGCHIGSFLSLAKKFAPEGHHAAIEASPEKAASLARHFPDTRIEQAAVTDFCGVARFEDDLAKPGLSRLTINGSKKNAIYYEVKTVTLDSLRFWHFDLIKIDIEGNELKALRGGSEFLSRCRPTIIFESGPAEGVNRAELFEYLLSLDYQVFTFGDFLYGKGPLNGDEFRKCGLYPFRAFNFIAMPL